ncbi:ABC transporter related [Catenulispora acidiphila DSM 44928]|uniref:ABC transporter related n=1 Tax=Catenulispora acidiphila (strain DSM 44928 / JCM 14897 / NBRC 102108 / NRRL B-24433 / ID139908) TaxID=479433 RepID=C7QE77_CATAD|nr:ATP-binding cassette domain-containing protein [Catenulispora acidiphila]ACU76665.1 ABC transporter related [Catenulispora acidiphila DSM 44928]
MIEIENLTKRYGARYAVRDLTFSVRPGRVTGFLGPNGAGKSTTMRAVLGLDLPTAGRVLVDGRPYAALERPLTHVGMLLDTGGVHPGRSARQHLRAVAAAGKLSERRVDEVLARVGLTDVSQDRVGGYSLGMRQRLGIATALLGDPGILMFDEPVNGLDPEGIRWIRDLMKGLAAEGRTVFVSSHLMSEMESTADHLVVIGRGRLIADLPARELIERYGGGFLSVRTDDPGRLITVLAAAGAQVAPEGPDTLRVVGMAGDAVARLAYQAGVLVLDVVRRATSLEDAYLQLTDAAVEYRGVGA